MTSNNGINTKHGTDPSAMPTWAHTAESPEGRQHSGSFTWRDVLSHRSISKVVLSDVSPLRRLLENVENKSPRIGVFLRHLFDDRILHLREHLDAVVTEETTLFEKHRQRVRQFESDKRADARLRLDEAQMCLQKALVQKEKVHIELLEADRHAAQATAKVGISFWARPMQTYTVEGMDGFFNREGQPSENYVYGNAKASNPETNEQEEQKGAEEPTFLGTIVDKATGAINYLFSRGKGSSVKTNVDPQQEKRSHQNADFEHRMTLHNQYWNYLLDSTYKPFGLHMYREMQPDVEIGAVAAKNGIPYYALGEFAEEQARRDDENADSLSGNSQALISSEQIQQQLMHRRFHSPLIPAKQLIVCTTAVGALVGVSLALIFRVITPRDLAQLLKNPENLYSIVPFIAMGIGVAFTSRYAVTLSFLMSGEMHAVANFTNAPNKNEAARLSRQFFWIGVVVLLVVLTVDYSVEFGGIAQLISADTQEAVGSFNPPPQVPLMVLISQFFAPLIVLVGYLVYCAFEGFLRGRDGVSHNYVLSLYTDQVDQDKQDRGLTQEHYSEAIEATHLFLAKQREFALINYEIETQKEIIRIAKLTLNGLPKHLEMSEQAQQRIQVAHEDLVGATRQFDDLTEQTYLEEMRILENQVLDLEKKREELRKDIKIIAHSIEHTQDLAKTQAQTVKLREELAQDDLNKDRHHLKLEKDLMDADNDTEKLQRKLVQDRVITDRRAEETKQRLAETRGKTQQRREEKEQAKIDQEIKAIQEPPRSFFQKWKDLWKKT